LVLIEFLPNADLAHEISAAPERLGADVNIRAKTGSMWTP
jgi:hypothetical protein